ncbi:MAG: hypothetical protein IJT12_03285 [Paludibacteraceae bacterium]|nr:hypothetical protein [Paludibacteraceae bacterium]
MAKARVGAAGIEYIQGALLKPKKANGHSHGNYLVATHRSDPTTSDSCQRLYTKPADAYKRTTPVSSEETLARTRFGEIGKAVALRRKNLSYVSTDVANFKAQQETGYKTLRQYLWHLCADEYDAQNNG